MSGSERAVRTVWTPLLSQAFDLVQRQSCALVHMQIAVNFLHALGVSVLHGSDASGLRVGAERKSFPPGEPESAVSQRARALRRHTSLKVVQEERWRDGEISREPSPRNMRERAGKKGRGSCLVCVCVFPKR